MSDAHELNRSYLENFLEEYNSDVDKAEAEIEAGDYLTQDEVMQLLADRRNALK